ncbi:integrase core domain-containing protein [Deinococcus oregonensis]|uniref:Integrase core domain-containing protein n=1 Tax=Deinococcus oregonensis TaxID=1805970 RepID=A0ABV6B0H6_9DEIO
MQDPNRSVLSGEHFCCRQQGDIQAELRNVNANEIFLDGQNNLLKKGIGTYSSQAQACRYELFGSGTCSGFRLGRGNAAIPAHARCSPPVARTICRVQSHTQHTSRKGDGDCWDNAAMESFFATLKLELELNTAQGNRAYTRHLVFEWIEVFYNRKRRHASLGYRSTTRLEQHRATLN